MVEGTVTASVSSRECGLLAIAVRAQEPEVFEPIIGMVAVYVIENQCQWLAPPKRGRITLITMIDQDPFANEPALELRGGNNRRSGDENLGERSLRCPGVCPTFEMSLPREMRDIEMESGEVRVHGFIICPSRRESEECEHASDGETGLDGLDDLFIRVTSVSGHDYRLPR
jgi:hypothetical protein